MVDYTKINHLVLSNDAQERIEALDQIRNNFKILLYKEKEQATKDLLALTKDEDSFVRRGAASAIGQAFQYVTDKEQATKELLELAKDEDSDVRRRVASVLRSDFQYVTDKEQATKDLLALTKDEDNDVRRRVASALGRAFQYMTDKEQATKELLELAKDEDSDVRRRVTTALGRAFQYMTDKEQATKELLELAKDEDSDVRRRVTTALGRAFQYMTDKEQATKELLGLTKDEDSDVRRRVTTVLGRAFQYMTDKEQATKELLGLTKDEDSDVRCRASTALGVAFQYMTDKEQATKELLELTGDKDSDVRRGATTALGVAFQHVTDKKQATKELLELTGDKDRNVRVSVNYSLGKISIYRATEAESKEILKEELNKAIEYFEKSSRESKFYFNPASFCLPFYRSYNAVIFRKEEAKEEIERNLEEAKQAVEGSESKEKLLGAIENLANALQEAQKLRGLDEIKSDLNAYRRYCDRTVELLNETEDKAPGAAKLVRRGLPIIDERIKAILTEIQEKTEALCKETVNSPLEDLGKEVNKIGQGLAHVRDPIALEKSVSNLEFVLSNICNHIGGKEKGEACKLLEKSKKEQYVEDKINLINILLTNFSSLKKETEHEKSNGDTFNKQTGQVSVATNKNSEINKQNSGIINRIHAESTRKIMEILGISFTIAGVIWGISYAILIEME